MPIETALRKPRSISLAFALMLVLVAVMLACSSRSSNSAASTDAAMDDAGAASRVAKQHRAAPIDCPSDRPRGITGGSGGTCADDSECTAGKNGRCIRLSISAPPSCSYDECRGDADCGGSAVCDCRNDQRGGANACIKGTCRVDADCKGRSCSPSAIRLGGTCLSGIPVGAFGWFCHRGDDECVDDADCAGSSGSVACMFDPDALHWQCRNVSCTF